MGKFDLELLVNQEAGVHIVTILGAVDSASLDGFKSKLDSVCTVPGAQVVLDCKGLTYLNSRSIGLLMKYHRSLLLSHGRLALCQLSQKLTCTLELLQLNKAIAIYPTLDQARAALS